MDEERLDFPAMAEYIKIVRGIPQLRPMLIHHPTELQALVRALNGVTDPLTLEVMAGDPNTSLEALKYLAGAFPAAFCVNPIFPLLLLENPNLPADMDYVSLGRLLAYPGVPNDFLSVVALYGPANMAQAARLHVALAGEAGSDWEAELTAALAGIPNLPGDDLLVTLAVLRLIPGWLHDRVAAGGDPRILRALGHAAKEVAAPMIVSPQVAGSNDPRIMAAGDPTTTLEELWRLADDENVHIRVALVSNSALGPHDLARLKTQEDWADCDPAVYKALAANPCTPPDVLRDLAANRSALFTVVRRAVALNPAAPPEVLDLLADELYGTEIRLILATHPNLNAEQRARMVAQALNAALGSGDPIYRTIALAQPAIDPEALELAPGSPHWIERLAAARNSALSEAGRAILRNDGNRLVRAAAWG